MNREKCAYFSDEERREASGKIHTMQGRQHTFVINIIAIVIVFSIITTLLLIIKVRNIWCMIHKMQDPAAATIPDSFASNTCHSICVLHSEHLHNITTHKRQTQETQTVKHTSRDSPQHTSRERHLRQAHYVVLNNFPQKRRQIKIHATVLSEAEVRA